MTIVKLNQEGNWTTNLNTLVQSINEQTIIQVASYEQKRAGERLVQSVNKQWITFEISS